MNTPPPGTMCVDCGCCPANLYAGDSPICWECDAGEPCKNHKDFCPAPIAEPIMQMETTNMLTPKEADALLEAIKAEPLTTSNVALAKKLDKSEYFVRTTRIKLGLYKPRQYGEDAVEPQRTSEKIMAQTKQQNKAEERVAQKQPSKPLTKVVKAADSIEVAKHAITIHLSEDRADKIWQNFSPEEKALAVKTVIQAQLEAL